MSTIPPPGWYPAPNGSSTAWWWDGRSWADPRPRLVATPAILGLAVATRVLLVVGGVLSMASIGVEVLGITAVEDQLRGAGSAFARLEAYDLSSLVVVLLSGAVSLATGIVWMCWQYRVAMQVAGKTRRSPGWHAGAWLVPFVALWFPYQNISDLWRAIGRTPPRWLIVWWLLWLGSHISVQISNQLAGTEPALEEFRALMWSTLANGVMLVAATPFAWLIVHRITHAFESSVASSW